MIYPKFWQTTQWVAYIDYSPKFANDMSLILAHLRTCRRNFIFSIQNTSNLYLNRTLSKVHRNLLLAHKFTWCSEISECTMCFISWLKASGKSFFQVFESKLFVWLWLNLRARKFELQAFGSEINFRGMYQLLDWSNIPIKLGFMALFTFFDS